MSNLGCLKEHDILKETDEGWNLMDVHTPMYMRVYHLEPDGIHKKTKFPA
jgi:hypothetical protein